MKPETRIVKSEVIQPYKEATCAHASDFISGFGAPHRRSPARRMLRREFQRPLRLLPKRSRRSNDCISNNRGEHSRQPRQLQTSGLATTICDSSYRKPDWTLRVGFEPTKVQLKHPRTCKPKPPDQFITGSLSTRAAKVHARITVNCTVAQLAFCNFHFPFCNFRSLNSQPSTLN